MKLNESNLGMYGIKDFTAVINPPHATIHGALGAELIGAFKALIENPVMMVV